MDLTKQLQAYEVEYQVLNDELHAPSDFSQHQRAAQLERIYQSLQQQNSQLQEELQVHTHTHTSSKGPDVLLGLINVLLSQVSQARVSSLENQMESLVQSESLLKERVSTLELEKKQLADTVARLQQILTKRNIHTSPDGHTLASPSERPTGPAEAKGEECKDDSGLSSPLSDFPTCLITASGSLPDAQFNQSGSKLGTGVDFYPVSS